MKYTAASLVAVASHLAGVAAHGGVLSYVFGGKTYQGFVPYNTPVGQVSIQREWDTYNPIQDVTSSMLSCNNNGTALASGAQLTATIAAGSAITAQWNQVWPHNTGPMLTYLAQCPGSTCDTANSISLKWFKIDQAGLLSGTVGNGSWAAGKMIAQNSSWTSTIPATVPPGNYLIRFETIALHSMPAQNYPECAQLQITGNGNVPPPSSILVTFPGAYSQTDPGINIDLYSQDAQTQSTYVIPGPPLYPGTGATSVPAQTTTKPVQTSTPPPNTTTKPPATTSVPPATTSAPTGATVPKYGQCGGQGWTGGTVCAAGSTCTVSNQYYSQCL